MPELPEVEVTCRGIAPHLVGRRIAGVAVRESRLRWPIPDTVRSLAGRVVRRVTRRGKYLLLDCGAGHLILHLGMSGSLRMVAAGTPPGKHDHFDLGVGEKLLRLRDPRRFGAVLWTTEPPEAHPLIRHLGIEPLSRALDGARLHALTRGHRAAIKQFLMDGRRVVGVGNIYANESLFRAGIRPGLPANKLSKARAGRLIAEVRNVLTDAIAKGGSTLRDYVDANGDPGYFQLDYFVYGRKGAPCRVCGHPLKSTRHGQRATFYCAHCQV